MADRARILALLLVCAVIAVPATAPASGSGAAPLGGFHPQGEPALRHELHMQRNGGVLTAVPEGGRLQRIVAVGDRSDAHVVVSEHLAADGEGSILVVAGRETGDQLERISLYLTLDADPEQRVVATYTDAAGNEQEIPVVSVAFGKAPGAGSRSAALSLPGPGRVDLESRGRSEAVGAPVVPGGGKRPSPFGVGLLVHPVLLPTLVLLGLGLVSRTAFARRWPR